LALNQYPNLLLLAVKTAEDWMYNPSHDFTLKPGNVLIFMTTSEERARLEDTLRGR
jgi:uncharacterized protein with PhoU and TrkA domain